MQGQPAFASTTVIGLSPQSPKGGGAPSEGPFSGRGEGLVKRSMTSVLKKFKDLTGGDKPRGKVSGHFNYEFALEAEGTSLFQEAGYLIAKATVQSRDLTELAIPTRCRWFRLIRERKYEVPGVSGK